MQHLEDELLLEINFLDAYLSVNWIPAMQQFELAIALYDPLLALELDS